MEREVIVERQVVTAPADEGSSSTASNAIWAFAFVVIVGLLAGAIYYSGIMKKGSAAPAAQEKINIKVAPPSN
ncbi:hypothetical protein BH10ACI3_BH10ACI3_04780 [soil metagenome]